MSTSSGTVTETRAKPPLDDLTYDLVSLVYEKTRALEVIDRSVENARDAGEREILETLEQMRRQEAAWIEQIQFFLGWRLVRGPLD